eukprot:jgi/Psemu1/25157/gm1.25157_g
MPPSGLLVALYPTEYTHQNGTGSPSSASPAQQQSPGKHSSSASILAAPVEPAGGSIGVAAASSSAAAGGGVVVASPLPLLRLSPLPSLLPSSLLPSLMDSPRSRCFLELEDDNNSDDDDDDNNNNTPASASASGSKCLADDLDYTDAMLEDIPLDDDDDDDDNYRNDYRNHEDVRLDSVFDAVKIPLPEKEHEHEYEYGESESESESESIHRSSTQEPRSVPSPRRGTTSSSPSTAQETKASNRLRKASVRGRGKRRRNRHRVSFPCTLHSLEDSLRFAAGSRNGINESSISSQSNSRSLVRIRTTIHRSDYTPSEKLATWYTFADLRSFKRERKETARLIDHGMLSMPYHYHSQSQSQSSSQNDDSCSDSDSHSSESNEHSLLPSVSGAGEYDTFDSTTTTTTSSTSNFNSNSNTNSHHSSSPVVYCARGCENCTEHVGRIRYRHIADGWRSVLNAQDKHRYRQQKLAGMSSYEQNHGTRNSNYSQRSIGIGNSSGGWLSRPGPAEASTTRTPTPCCPYVLADAYRNSSRASLDVARNRAIGDEREVLAQRRREEARAARLAAAAASAADAATAVQAAASMPMPMPMPMHDGTPQSLVATNGADTYGVGSGSGSDSERPKGEDGTEMMQDTTTE